MGTAEDEHDAIEQALASAGSAKKAATQLGVSLRTLLRRMRQYKIKIAKRGRPRTVVFSRFTEATRDDILKREGAYWRSRPIEERISAVEIIRDQTTPGYRTDTARLERVYSRSRLGQS